MPKEYTKGKLAHLKVKYLSLKWITGSCSSLQLSYWIMSSFVYHLKMWDLFSFWWSLICSDVCINTLPLVLLFSSGQSCQQAVGHSDAKKQWLPFFLIKACFQPPGILTPQYISTDDFFPAEIKLTILQFMHLVFT